MKHTPETSITPPVGVLYITEEDAAARYSVSTTFIRRLRLTGRLACIAIGPKTIRYSVADLDRHFAALAVGGASGRCGAVKGEMKSWRASSRNKPRREKQTGGASA